MHIIKMERVEAWESAVRRRPFLASLQLDPIPEESNETITIRVLLFVHLSENQKEIECNGIVKEWKQKEDNSTGEGCLPWFTFIAEAESHLLLLDGCDCRDSLSSNKRSCTLACAFLPYPPTLPCLHPPPQLLPEATKPSTTS